MRQKRLQKYVKKYFAKHPEVKLVTVTGSIGKTQAKIAIATILAQRYRVRLFHGNRGTNFSTPLAILGIDYPGDIKGFGAWHKVFKAARQRIKQPQDVDVIVQELNATAPGSLMAYADYITPDIAVVTAVSESNIEAFHSLDAIAQEQISIGTISRSLLVNRDDIDSSFAKYLTNPNMNTYGLEGSAEYRFEEADFSVESGYSGVFIAPDWSKTVSINAHVYDSFMLRQIIAACTVGVKLGMSPQEIVQGVDVIAPLSGHVNKLQGVEDGIILDDTANTSPLGARTALQALYQIPSPQKVAVLGSMRKLGAFAQTAHHEIGELCDPGQLAWVITVGDEANRWLAPVARGKGCQVKECANALEAGAFAHRVVEQGSVALFNGHEDDILEEGVKVILHATADEDKLVRQSPDDLARKADAFSQYT